MLFYYPERNDIHESKKETGRGGRMVWKKNGIVIHTLEGNHLAKAGDFIIKGVHGEFYPCKPDIFKKTYEVLEDDHSM